MQLPKFAIFDMDGLLVDTETVLMEENAKVMEEYGYRQEFDDYIQSIGQADEEFFDTLYRLYGPDYPAEEIALLSRQRQIERQRRDGIPVKEGIPELLAFLREREVPCCVATSSKHVEAEEFLSLCSLDGYFDFIITFEDVPRSKPDPSIFLKACEWAGVGPAEAMVFEDSQNGVLAAFRAGIPVICIPDIKQPEPYYAEKATKVVRSALDVPALFDLH